MLALTLSFVAVLYLTGLRADRALTRPGATPATTHVPSRVVVGHHAPGLVSAGLYRGRTASYWAGRFRVRSEQFRRANERARDMRRVLFARGSVREAIELAGATYGSTSMIWSLARCESHLWPYAHNPSGASGLMQFLPSTFASTPYGHLSIWSPYANAMAGGWMLAHGRRSEWVC